ncbi:OmpA family protein [Novosphingobium guangzhouense]|uniref:Cell envelope biogenesis protein OmpA n=1 Tax=Novosphingobium guangzhouense TaxID=1850347 RepID=A0A2K2FVV6_9SPHN|nr:OmpA family protein [Novosphingobium guangzhouense]PNU02910.1 cell envelope biogenesis protein OmpA [Novosphingobium guangzhouense]
MSVISKTPRILLMAALLGGVASVSVSAQDAGESDLSVQVTDTSPEMVKGPDVKGIISARSGDRMQVTAEDGTRTVVTINDATKIKASKGFLGLGSDKLAATSLLNGIPVEVETLQGGGALLASKIDLKGKDMKTAQMIHNGTDQRFASNEAATEGLKARMGDIDKYNIKGTTNVNFDTGKSKLSPEAKQSLCQAATQAEAQENALLLVVGYTDSTGSEEINQALSEKRASAVVNYLQQACHWKPYRMLTPTGMSMADPVADNTTEEGKALNRRVAVNIMVSKAVDGI